MRALAIALLALMIGACATTPDATAVPEDAFMARLQAHCGKAFAGRLVSGDAADAAMRGQPLVMHVAQCRDGEVRIPFSVGSDRSRTWVIRRVATGIELRHVHRHADGSLDEVTDYGGFSRTPGTAGLQHFPADAKSQALFVRTDRAVSIANVWAVAVDERRFAYELRRPPGSGERFFRVEFDLARPVATPPAPWDDKVGAWSSSLERATALADRFHRDGGDEGEILL